MNQVYNGIDTKDMELQTVTERGRPAARRLASAAAAHAIFKRYKESDADDALRRATIQGMIDGNPPYVQAELEDAGLAHMINVNFMSMRANLDARAGAAHELFMEVPTLIECSLRKPDQLNRGVSHFLGVLSEEFTETVRGWPGFLVNMDLAYRESDAYGIGFALFQDEYTWKPKAYKRGNLLFDPMASVDMDENDVYIVRDAMTAGDLFRKIENPDVAREEGWNVTAVELVLRSVFLSGENGDSSDKYQRSIVETIQQMSRNNDPDYQDKQFDKVRIAHLLVREVCGDQKISHFIIPENDTHKLFLYEGYDRFENMHQVLWWLPFNYGDGFARSVRGVGSWMAQHDDLSNRFLCRVFDSGFMVSSLLLQPKTPTDLGRLQFVQHGPYTVVPSDMDIKQASFQPQLAPLIQLRDVSEQVMKNNTGMYRQHPETVGDGGAPKTARQVMEETAKEARMEKAAVAHRYNHLELLYREMYRRLVNAATVGEGIEFDGKKEAKDFRRRCLDRGVPAEWLGKDYDKHVYLRATHAIGLGSLAVKYDITNQLMGMAGFLDAEGQVYATRERLAALVGYRNVDKYRPAVSRDQIPSSEHSVATLENNDFLAGQPVVAGSEQLHQIHVGIHVGPLQEIMQAYEQGQVRDPMQALTAMQGGMAHLSQHLQFMSQTKANEQLVVQMQQFLQDAQKVAQALERDVVRMQREQEKLQEENDQKVADADQVLKDRELEAKIYEINRKFEVETMKQQSLNQMRADKTAEQLRIRREQVARETELKAQKQQADIDIARAKAAAETSVA